MFRRTLLLAAGASLLAACGSDGPPPDTTAPSASITFPSRTSLTDGDRIRIAGTASDDGSVVEVTVNGIAAVSTDGFATWSAEVPVAYGATTLRVNARDQAGNQGTDLARVDVVRSERILNPFGAERDAATGLLYFVDSEANAIGRLDPATGVVSHIADIATFRNNSSNHPLDLALDLENDRILLGVRYQAPDDTSTIGVWQFDLSDAAWSIVSDSARGAGPALQNPSDLVLAPGSQQLYVLDFNHGIFTVNLANGDRALLSSNTLPTTALQNFQEPTDMALDANGNRLLVVDRVTDSLFAVDIATGARTLISQTGVQAGPALEFPLALAVDSADNVAWVYDYVRGGVLGIDLLTGARTLLTNNAAVFGVLDDDLRHGDLRSLMLAGDELISIDNQVDNAIAVHTGTLARRRLASNAFPELQGRSPNAAETLPSAGVLHVFDWERDGQLFRVNGNNQLQRVAGADVIGSRAVSTEHAVIDATANVAYVAEYDFDAGLSATVATLTRVDLATGVVGIVSDGATAPGGPYTAFPRGIALDREAGNVYLLTRSGVYRIRISDGDRQLLAAPTGNEFDQSTQVSLDRRNGRLLVAGYQQDHLIAIDTGSGASSVFSGPTSSGPAFGEVVGVAVDANGAIWASDSTLGIFRVDAQTGARTLVSSPTGSDTTNLPLPYEAWSRLYADGDALYAANWSSHLTQIDKATGGRAVMLKSRN